MSMAEKFDKGLGRVIKIAGLLALLSTPLLAFNGRVAAIERVLPALLYMGCVNFAERHPANQVPAVCNEVTRQ